MEVFSGLTKNAAIACSDFFSESIDNGSVFFTAKTMIIKVNKQNKIAVV